ncbi:MAG: sulfite exporter TauE/SafE family protein [Bacteroidetes bacterium]|nr:sulfite exporter TauE/SafE family protein [Bacteroidota bacterium]
METIRQLSHSLEFPILSAFLLGVLTAISPCPLATNITAIAYISKTLTERKKVLLSGVLYTLGLALAYTLIAGIILFGASKFHVARFFQSNGEKFVGPVMILIGLVMLNVIRLKFFSATGFAGNMQDRFKDKGLLGAFLLGMLFALAFCPYSGAMYFGVLIPMSINSSEGIILPVFYALGAGSLVLFFTVLIAFGIKKVGKYYKAIGKFEKVTRLIAALLFIFTGIYYVLIYFEILSVQN